LWNGRSFCYKAQVLPICGRPVSSWDRSLGNGRSRSISSWRTRLPVISAYNDRMKIENLKTVVVNAEMRNWVFCKVETDQPGLYGWGEGSLEWKTRSVVGAIEDFAPMVIGEDPRRIEHIFQKLYRQSFWRLGVIGMSAISAIEQALWDIKGKLLGVPVYELLGGQVRDRVRMYTHLGGGNMKSVYETFDVEPLIDLALKVVGQGYTAVKVVFVPYSEPLEGIGKVKQFAKLMGKLRECVGEQVDVMIDFHGRTIQRWRSSILMLSRSFDLTSVKSRYRPKTSRHFVRFGESVQVPIATGERLVGRHQFRPLFEQRACHVIQPDLCHCGGLFEAKKNRRDGRSLPDGCSTT